MLDTKDVEIAKPSKDINKTIKIIKKIFSYNWRKKK
jgi:hypothetical protein